MASAYNSRVQRDDDRCLAGKLFDQSTQRTQVINRGARRVNDDLKRWGTHRDESLRIGAAAPEPVENF